MGAQLRELKEPVNAELSFGSPVKLLFVATVMLPPEPNIAFDDKLPDVIAPVVKLRVPILAVLDPTDIEELTTDVRVDGVVVLSVVGVPLAVSVPPVDAKSIPSAIRPTGANRNTAVAIKRSFFMSTPYLSSKLWL